MRAIEVVRLVAQRGDGNFEAKRVKGEAVSGQTAGTMRLQERDLELFDALRQARFLTSSQIAAHFFSHRSGANRRLSKLEAAGLVARDHRGVTEEAIWRPTGLAIRALVKAGRLASGDGGWTWKQGQSRVDYKQHECDINALWLALERGAKHYPGVEVVRCLGGRKLNDHVVDRHGTRYTVSPDRFVQLRRRESDWYYLIEVDRGTKPLKRQAKPGSRYAQDVRRQLFAYTIYAERGGFARKYGPRGARAGDWWFRLLVTAPTAARRNNMMECLIREMASRGYTPPASALRGYAVFDQVTADPYGKCWLREVELAPILVWLSRLPVGKPLGECLPRETRYDPVRDALGPRILKLAYRRSPRPGRDRPEPVRDDAVREALIDALVATGALRAYSILEPWPMVSAK